MNQELQLKYRASYLVIDIDDRLAESLFVCLNKSGHCWVQSSGNKEALDLSETGINFAKAPNSRAVAEFIMNNGPQTFEENGFISVHTSQQANAKMCQVTANNNGTGVTSRFDAAQADIPQEKANYFISTILNKNDSGAVIMDKLKKNNEELHYLLSLSRETNISRFDKIPPPAEFEKFCNFIKRSW